MSGRQGCPRSSPLASGEMFPDNHGDVIDVGNGLWDRHRLTVRLYNIDPGLRVSFDRLDLIPSRDKASVTDAVLVDRYSIPLLHHPADHRENVNDQERGREDKVDELLAEVKDHQHRHEEKEGYDRDDRGSLKEGRGSAVDADDRAKVF